MNIPHATRFLYYMLGLINITFMNKDGFDSYFAERARKVKTFGSRTPQGEAMHVAPDAQSENPSYCAHLEFLPRKYLCHFNESAAKRG